MRFADRVVWITGASSGIGEALAYAFHREGARLILSARREAELARVAAACRGGPGRKEMLPLDVAAAETLAERAAAAEALFGRIDILVNGAGITHRALVKDTDMAVFRRVMEVDFFGAVALTKAVLPGMLARGEGHLVTLSSVAGTYGSPFRSGYAAAKHALHGFFDSLRGEVARDGVAVTVIVAGPVRTGITVSALRGDGSPWGREDRLIAEGLAPEDAAAQIVEAVAARREEVVIGRGEPCQLVQLKRVAPERVTRRLRLARRG